MTKKITKITKEQSARFDEWRDRWIAIGLSTEPADFDAAERAALALYDLCKLKRPRVVLRMGSPFGATLGGAVAVLMLGNKKVGSQVWSQVWSQVKSQVRSQVRSQVGAATLNYRGGQLWASWGAYVSFFRDVMGWHDPVLANFVLDEALTVNSGWVWWHEDVVAISDRPREIHRDNQGRLHSLTGPAIRYPDGWAIHCVNGVSVPAKWIEDKDNLDPAEVLKAENVEQRAAGATIIGWPKMAERLTAK